MIDYSFLEDHKATGKTKKYTMSEIVVAGVSPVFEVKCATMEDTEWASAVFTKHNSVINEVATGNMDKEMDVDKLHEFHKKDVELFAEHIVVNWENVLDGKGNDIPFKEKNVRDYLSKVPTTYFNRLKMFCEDEKNFLDSNKIKEYAALKRVDEVAKN